MANRLFELLICVEDNENFCEGQGEKSEAERRKRRDLGHWTSDLLTISFQKIILLNPAGMRILGLPRTTFYAQKFFQV
jgi:hypothetical protein